MNAALQQICLHEQMVYQMLNCIFVHNDPIYIAHDPCNMLVKLYGHFVSVTEQYILKGKLSVTLTMLEFLILNSDVFLINSGLWWKLYRPES